MPIPDQNHHSFLSAHPAGLSSFSLLQSSRPSILHCSVFHQPTTSLSASHSYPTSFPKTFLQHLLPKCSAHLNSSLSYSWLLRNLRGRHECELMSLQAHDLPQQLSPERHLQYFFLDHLSLPFLHSS